MHPIPTGSPTGALYAQYAILPASATSMLRNSEGADSPPLINAPNFVLATRDTGYRSITSALAELVDNSLQAGATRVQIFIELDGTLGQQPRVSVLDNGTGMSPRVMQQALQFGGSERFGDRSGLGRFGMGLPNSSLSQARRVDLFSWMTASHSYHTWLDLDEVVNSPDRGIPTPVPSSPPFPVGIVGGPHGTLVVWSHCDRLPVRRLGALVSRLASELGRIYRFPLWDGLRLLINGTPVRASDPMLLRPPRGGPRGRPFGSPLEYEINISGDGAASTIRVRFSELPVATWKGRPIEDRRRFGIIGGAGVSFVRAGREIDFGWHLMGSKRRENYDDWWRCEICFEPALDELFGVSHSKQGVRPTAELRDLIAADLEEIARTLNRRVRERFQKGVAPAALSRAVRAASERDKLLPGASSAGGAATPARVLTAGYRIEARDLRSGDFFALERRSGTRVLVLNRLHPFYEGLYRALEPEGKEEARFRVECLLLAAARALDPEPMSAEAIWADRVRAEWSDALAAFLT